MLAEAIEAKARELGTEYSYRDLGADSGVSYSYVSKVIHGKARPSERVIHRWGKALAPYFNVDLALAASGYLPADQEKRAAFQEMAGWDRSRWRRFMLAIQRQVAAADRDLGLPPEEPDVLDALSGSE